MADYDLQCFDASGQLVFDTQHFAGIALGAVIATSANGSVQHPGLSLGLPFLVAYPTTYSWFDFFAVDWSYNAITRTISWSITEGVGGTKNTYNIYFGTY